jgi:hypothetical protein
MISAPRAHAEGSTGKKVIKSDEIFAYFNK